MVHMVTLKYWKRFLWPTQGSAHHCVSCTVQRLLDFSVGLTILEEESPSTCPFVCTWCPQLGGALGTSLCAYFELCGHSGQRARNPPGWWRLPASAPRWPERVLKALPSHFLLFFLFPSGVLPFPYWICRDLQWKRDRLWGMLWGRVSRQPQSTCRVLQVHRRSDAILGDVAVDLGVYFRVSGMQQRALYTQLHMILPAFSEAGTVTPTLQMWKPRPQEQAGFPSVSSCKWLNQDAYRLHGLWSGLKPTVLATFIQFICC